MTDIKNGTSLPKLQRLSRRGGFLGFLLVVGFTVAAVGTTAHAQSNSTQSPAPGTDASATQSPPNPAAPVQYAPSPGKYQKAVAYSSAHYRHVVLSDLWGITVPLLILWLGLATRYRDWAERISGRRFVQVLVFAPLFLLTIALFSLPFDLLDESLERQFGRSVQGWSSWIADWLISQVVVWIVGAILIWILYAVIRRSPRRWWFYFWLAAIPILLAVFFVQPLVIDPLFFKFTPLQAKHPELVEELEKVVEHGGMHIPPDRMFEMNASSKQTSWNAYVTGFGASKRAVVWDNTIRIMTIGEILVVFGHEMGHYVLHHIPKQVGIDALLLLGLLYLGYRLASRLQARHGAGQGIRSLDDWASLPMLMFVLTLLTFCADPIFLAVSRYFEHEADRYGLEVVHGIVPDQARVAAEFFQRSGEINLADPNPGTLVKIWFFDHPTRPERVHFAATYDPWTKGEPPRYVK